MYETDISVLYNDLKLDDTRKYYVYAPCEPQTIAINRDSITTWFAMLGAELMPFYIGIGCDNRAYDLNRNETRRKVKQRLMEFNQAVHVNILCTDLTELEALCIESKIVDISGIIGKGGKLVNLDEGLNPKERQQLHAEHLRKINKYYENSLKVVI